MCIRDRHGAELSVARYTAQRGLISGVPWRRSSDPPSHRRVERGIEEDVSPTPDLKGVSGTLQVGRGETGLTYRVMRRKFVSLLVAVLVGAMPVAHELCSAGCSGNVATTAHSHHHEGAP